MSRYFPKGRALLHMQAERQWAIVIAAWGILSTAAGLAGLFYRPLLLVEGMGVPFFLLGIPLIGVGIQQFTWSFRHADIIQSHPAHLPKHFLQEEWERVEALLPILQRGRELSLLFLVFGLSLTLVARLLEWGPFSLGMGTGLIIQSAFSLVYLLFRVWRNELYQHELEVAGH